MIDFFLIFFLNSLLYTRCAAIIQILRKEKIKLFLIWISLTTCKFYITFFFTGDDVIWSLVKRTFQVKKTILWTSHFLNFVILLLNSVNRSTKRIPLPRNNERQPIQYNVSRMNVLIVAKFTKFMRRLIVFIQENNYFTVILRSSNWISSSKKACSHHSAIEWKISSILLTATVQRYWKGEDNSLYKRIDRLPGIINRHVTILDNFFSTIHLFNDRQWWKCIRTRDKRGESRGFLLGKVNDRSSTWYRLSLREILIFFDFQSRGSSTDYKRAVHLSLACWQRSFLALSILNFKIVWK